MENKKEPLMNVNRWADSKNIMQWKTDVIEAYAKYHTKWHLNNVKEVVCEEAEIGFDGEWKITVYKQSITNAVEKYINEKL